MLVSQGLAALGPASLRSALVLGPQVALVVLDRTGLVFDARFLPAAGGPPRAHAFLYFLVAGTFAIEGGPSFEGPCAFVLSEEQFEGARGTRPLTYRTSGEPFRAVEVHLESTHLRGLATATPPPLFAVGDDAWRACHALLDGRDDDALVRAATTLVGALAAEGLVAREVVPREGNGPPTSSRLWQVVRPIIERHAPLSRLKELGADLSLRQLARDLETFTRAYALVMRGGWRETTSRYRLKLAVLFASASGCTVADIAKLVGYGDGDALARAFREAKLPPPTELQRRLARQPS